jgi:tRNA (mo5U34)-methyltransferase
VEEPSAFLSLPSAYPREEVESALSRYDDWFYEFVFANGAATTTPGDLVRSLHYTKPRLILPFLDHFFRGRWGEIECLDMACHQGWFSIQTALRGARRVHGVDVRSEHVERASLVRDLSGLSNVGFEQRNLFDLDPDRDGRYDLTLFLGILYHLADPVKALKIARAMTTELCVVETQVARPVPEMEYLWGSDPGVRRGHAIAVGRVGERHVAEDTEVVLVPTVDALYYLLHAAGFQSLSLAVPPRDAQDQYRDFDRVVVFAGV